MNFPEQQPESSHAPALRKRLREKLELLLHKRARAANMQIEATALRLDVESPVDYTSAIASVITQTEATALLADIDSYVDSNTAAVAKALGGISGQDVGSPEWRQRALIYAVQSLARVGPFSEQDALTLLQQIQLRAGVNIVDIAQPPPQARPKPLPRNPLIGVLSKSSIGLADCQEIATLIARLSRHEARAIVNQLAALAEAHWAPTEPFSKAISQQFSEWVREAATTRGRPNSFSQDSEALLTLLLMRGGEPCLFARFEEPFYEQTLLRLASREGAQGVFRRSERLHPSGRIDERAFAWQPRPKHALDRDRVEEQLRAVATAGPPHDREIAEVAAYLTQHARGPNAFDSLAEMFRPDLKGRFLEYDAAEQLAAECRGSLGQPVIDALFCAAGLEVFLTYESSPERIGRILMDDRHLLDGPLDLSPYDEVHGVLKRLGELSRAEALRLLRFVIPFLEVNSEHALPFAQKFFDELERIARREGIGRSFFVFYNSHVVPGVRALFEAAGFPDLGALPHERMRAIRRVSPRLARFIYSAVEGTGLTDLASFLGIDRPSAEWRALEEVASELGDVSRLEHLASRTLALTQDAAWRELCSLLGCEYLANASNDPQAHKQLAIEVEAADNPKAALVFKAIHVRNSEVENGLWRAAIEERRKWRTLALAVAPDLAGKSDNQSARELVVAAMNYRGPEDLRPLIEGANLQTFWAERRSRVMLAAAVGRDDLAWKSDNESARELVIAAMDYRGLENLRPLIEGANLQSFWADEESRILQNRAKGKGKERQHEGHAR